MNSETLERLGGGALIVGAVLLSVYSIAFTFLLPVNGGAYDLAQLAMDPDWTWISLTSFVGVLLMIVGLMAVYSRLGAGSGIIGMLGIGFVELAYILQACKVTWELFLYRVIASHPESAFLLRDGVLKSDPMVLTFRGIASAVILLGIIFFCTALLRSKEFPKTAAILILAGALVYGLGPMLSVYLALGGIVALSLGFLALGARLTGRRYA
jgi:hypothetical protein